MTAPPPGQLPVLRLDLVLDLLTRGLSAAGGWPWAQSLESRDRDASPLQVGRFQI